MAGIKEISVEGCEVIGKGGQGTIYRLDDLYTVFRDMVSCVEEAASKVAGEFKTFGIIQEDQKEKGAERMSCWRRTTVLRISALFLGFEYWGEWDRFCEEHDNDFKWEPGWFAPSLCESYPYDEYRKLLPSDGRPCEEWDRLDMDLYPDTVKTVPGPFLDYCLEEICPLRPEDSTLHKSDVARPLTPEEKEKYLPLFRKLFPDFTIEKMECVHYCRYEWYDGSDAMYMY